MVGTIREFTTRYPALIVLITALALVAAIACSDDPKERTFEITQQGTFALFDEADEVFDDGGCPLLGGDGSTPCSVRLTGSGSGPPIGNYTEEAVWRILFTSETDSVIAAADTTLTASNGDQISFAAGPFDPAVRAKDLQTVGAPDADGVVPGVVNSAFVVVGGTGDFEGATGNIIRSGTFTVDVVPPNIGDGTFDITYTGTITY